MVFDAKFMELTYEVPSSVFWYEEGDLTLEDSMNHEGAEFSLEYKKEGATLKGWKVYEADSMNLVYEVGEEADSEYVWDSLDGEDDVYMVLRNATVYAECMSTEEMTQIICGDKCYYAVAIWE